MNPATRVVTARRTEEARRRTRRRSASTAAFLSFLFPGGGQLYNQQRRLAMAFALPTAAILGGLAIGALVLGDDLLPRLLDPRLIIGLLVLDVVVLGLRLVAILQAHARQARFRNSGVGVITTALLVVLVIGMHAAPAMYALKLLETVTAISAEVADSPGTDLRDRIPGLLRPQGGDAPQPTDPPDTGSARTNVVLVGIDSGVGRDHALTDTMLVVSLDPEGRSAMLSIPRDLVNAPLPNGEPYPWKLNSLLQTASMNPDAYPYGSGADTLKATLAELLGVPIHHFAAVDLAGFKRVIDVIGGVTIDVPEPLVDASSGLYLEAGPLYMDGELALRYVRSRYGAGNDDFARAARQQQVLAAIQQQLAHTNLLTALPALLDALQNTIATDVPSERIPELATAIQGADVSSMQRAVIQPPEYVTPAIGGDGAYILIPDLTRIRDLGQALLGG